MLVRFVIIPQKLIELGVTKLQLPVVSVGKMYQKVQLGGGGDLYFSDILRFQK